MLKRAWRTLGLAYLAFIGTSCNLLGWLDSPSSDAGHLARARACLDRGDVTCALASYARVSDSNASVRDAETAFAILEREGFTAAAFFRAVGAGNGGQIITSLANQLASVTTVNEAKRLALVEAYAKTAVITDSGLRGMVRLMGALAILAELLAESAGADRSLARDEIALGATACQAGVCAVEASCDAGMALGSETPPLDLDTANSMAGDASLIKVKAAIDEVVTALGSGELNAGGSVAAAISGVSSVLSALTLTNAGEARCFRQVLLQQGFGT